MLTPADKSEEILSSGAGPLGEEEASGTDEAEGSEAKTVLPPFEPSSPSVAGDESRLRVRLAKVQREERERAEDRRAQLDLQLHIRRLEIEADTQVKLRELDLRIARETTGSAYASCISCSICAVGCWCGRCEFRRLM